MIRKEINGFLNVGRMDMCNLWISMSDLKLGEETGCLVKECSRADSH